MTSFTSTPALIGNAPAQNASAFTTMWSRVLYFSGFRRIFMSAWAVSFFLTITAPFRCCITLIQCAVTNKQMIWRYTSTIITRMQYMHSSWNTAMSENVGKSMRSLYFPSYSVASLSIASGIERTLPNPTACIWAIFSPCKKVIDISGLCSSHKSTANIHKLAGGVK